MIPKTRLVVGIDFSRSRFHVALQGEDGQRLQRHRSFSNTRSGYQEAKRLLLETLQTHDLPTLEIGGEATSYYWLPMYLQFAQDPDWQPYNIHLYLLNAQWVYWFKKSRSPNHKTDQTDPDEIANYLRFQRPDTAWQYDARWFPLRFYTRFRYHLVNGVTREKNLFQLYLFLRYSAYSQQPPFSNVLGVTSQELLSDPQRLANLGQLPTDRLAEQLDEFAHHRLPNPLHNAEQLRQALAESLPLADELNDPLQFGLERLIDLIETQQSQIAQVEQQIQRLVEQDYPEVGWLDSIPGVGPVLASGIAAEIGDLERFIVLPAAKGQPAHRRRSQEVVDAISKYAGLWWPRNASGQFEADERKLSRKGNAYLRYYILEAADRMRQRIPRFQTYYLKKYENAHLHKHKRALLLTGCQALDLFVALLRRKESYCPKEVAGD